MGSKRTPKQDGSSDRAKRKPQKMKYYECPECSGCFPLPFGQPLLPNHRWGDVRCTGSGKDGI